MAANPLKIELMLTWPTPKDLKSLRGFMGLTGYYLCFVKNYGKLARHLTQLLRKDNFHWDEEAHTTFSVLNTSMIELSVPMVPNFSLPLVIERNASKKGLGVVLIQGGRPMAFMSQPLSGHTQWKSVYERESMTIVMAIQKWHH